MHTVSTSSLEARTTIRAISDSSLIEAERNADRLRSWAAVMSAEHSGEPFLRFTEEEWSVHLLAGDSVTSDPEAGVEVETLAAGSYILIENVDFYGIDNALDSLDTFVIDGSTGRDLGAIEFHSVNGGFAVGTLAVPVRGMPEGLPTELSIAAAPAIGMPDEEPDHHHNPPVSVEDEAPVVVPGSAPLTAIAITSQVGSLGETVAYLTAAELGWRYCRDSVVQEAAAGDPEIEVDDVERATRHRSRLERLLESLAATPMVPMDPGMAMSNQEPYLPPIVDDEDARAAVEETMFSLADVGGVVIAGHGAAQILRDHPTTLGVFIGAPEGVRVSRVANESMPFEEAERFVRDIDNERHSYFKGAYDADWRDALEYDLTLNSGSMSPRAAATVIAAVVRASQGK